MILALHMPFKTGFHLLFFQVTCRKGTIAFDGFILRRILKVSTISVILIMKAGLCKWLGFVYGVQSVWGRASITPRMMSPKPNLCSLSVQEELMYILRL